MNDYIEMYNEEVEDQKELEASIDGKYMRIIQLETKISELKKQIAEILKEEI